MKLEQSVTMMVAEPLMAIGALGGVLCFFAICGWLQSKYGWLWSHLLVTAPFFLFWLVACSVESSTGDSAKGFAWAALAMAPFAGLWVVRFAAKGGGA